ncbi:hypothetical protein [Sphingobium sp. IP1]|nr:hypothetical protein [Sphingobium sp. IP1]
MRAQLQQAVKALCMGRRARVVVAEIAAALAIACMLWLVACMFMAMGPLA